MHNEVLILRYTLYITMFLGLTTFFLNTSVGLGFFLGGSIGALTFRLIVLDASTLLQHVKDGQANRDKGNKFIRKGYLRRYLLYAATLIISIQSPYLNFITTLLGLLIPRITIYLHMLLGRKKSGN